MSPALLIYDSTERCTDLFYATRFDAPDAYGFLQKGRRSIILANALERDRAKRVAQVDAVHSWEKMVLAARARGGKTAADVLAAWLRSEKVKRVLMPQDTPAATVDGLRAAGVKVQLGPRPFFSQRECKTSVEVKHISAAQCAVFEAFAMVEEVLRSSRIRGDRLEHRGVMLTSERLQRMISVFLLERGFLAPDPIVACGKQACDPHERGHGPLRPHQSIIVDIFPRSLKSWYFGDATRTFCKGRASEALHKLYATVLAGQKLGLKSMRAGKNGRAIHEAINALFEREGYRTGEVRGRMQGFFHGTGHGIGLDLHEEPARISARDFTLKAGQTLTVEPGLYYWDIGGVRIEDIVHVVRSGGKILGKYPKRLEIP